MSESASKWWWLPGTLFYVSAAAWFVAALANFFWDRTSKLGVFVALSVVFFVLGTMNFHRRRPKPDSAAPNEPVK